MENTASGAEAYQRTGARANAFAPRKLINRLRPNDARAALVALLLSAGVIGLTVVLKYAVLLITGANAGFTVYIPAVAVAAWSRGLLAGVLATVLSALVDTLIFLPPVDVLLADIRDQQLRMFAYIAGGIVVSYVANLLRTERDHAREQAAESRRALGEAAAARSELDRVLALERRANELRDAFNSIISHELRTPITAIYGGAKLLARRDRKLDARASDELIRDLEAESDRLYRLVEDLLILAKSERGTIEHVLEPLLLPRIASRVIASENDRWPHVRFELRAATVSPARGEGTYVEQVLRNLLTNAAKYSPAKSVVDVIVDETAEGVRVRVLDVGPGVDPAETGRIFELYYRSPSTAAKASGAGIGLYVCRVLVEAMGGRIWAAARPGGGSEFGFVLERADAS